jgi:hypothetical protein
VDVEPLPDTGDEAPDGAVSGTGDSPLNDAADPDVASSDVSDGEAAISDAGGEAADAAASRTGDSPLNDAIDPDVAPSDGSGDPVASDSADDPIPPEGDSG